MLWRAKKVALHHGLHEFDIGTLEGIVILHFTLSMVDFVMWCESLGTTNGTI